MKYISTIAFFSFIFSQLSAQFNPGDIGYQQTEFELYKKNNVEAAHLTTLEMDGSMTPNQTNYYDKAGRLAQIVYNYDRVISPEARKAEKNDVFSYDNNNNVTSIIMHGHEINDIVKAFEHQNGKVITKRVTGAEEKVYSYTYDNNNNVIEVIGKTSSFEKDVEGNPTTKVIYNETEKNQYTWNNNNQLVQDVLYMNGGFYYKIKYNYNDKKQLIDYAVFLEEAENAIPAFTTSIEYSANGLPEKIVNVVMGFSSFTSISYTFY